MNHSCHQVVRQIQVYDEKLKNNDKDMDTSDSITIDLKRQYVATAQAADKLAFQTESLREPLLTKYVRLTETAGHALPTPLGRSITAAKGKEALRSWAAAGGKDAEAFASA